MALTSEQVNAIVYKYLQESGFRHSSFAFQHESMVESSAYHDMPIQPGMLINVIHKGLQFMDIEAHMSPDGELIECNAPFSLLGPHTCDLKAKDTHERSSPSPQPKRQRKEDRLDKKEQREKRPRKEEEDMTMDGNGASVVAVAAADPIPPAPETTLSLAHHPIESPLPPTAATLSPPPAEVVVGLSPPPPSNGQTVKEESSTTAGGDKIVQPKEDDLTATKEPSMIDPSEVVILSGHQSEVFCCSWNPVVSNLLASGSGDATARLWNVPDNNSQGTEPIVLNHLPNLNDSKDVTSLGWNPSGTLLASGSYDGQARIWTQKGQLRFVMEQHRGPIFSIKWNGKGDLVLSGSADTTTVVWDPKTGEMKQQFELHSLAILDVDWMDNTTFASCSSDKIIYVCRIGSTEPLKKWVGHEDEINAVRWDPSGKYLASCSDDKATKIWSLDSDQPVQEIRGHQLQIYTLQWAPFDEDDAHPRRLLATASFDATIRLWDALAGTCLRVFEHHTEPVYSISFSPDARYLASGSFDELLNVWDIKSGTLQKTFRADGGVFEVHFNKDGSKLAASTSNKQVVILDVKS